MAIIKPKLIGSFAHYISQLLVKTLRVNICFHPDVDPQGQYVYGFWHDKQFAPIMLMAKIGNRKQAGLVSPSGDGEMLTVWLKHLGYYVIRGSSSRKGMNGLVKLIVAAKKGYSIGITADGPRGPRHEAKSGIAFLACKSGLQILPLGVAYSSKWQFDKSWDKYQLPLPFSKVVIYVGDPMTVTDISNLDAVNARVGQAIQLSEKKANEILCLRKLGFAYKRVPAGANDNRS